MPALMWPDFRGFGTVSGVVVRFPALDVYRVIAAYAVLFYHYAYRGERTGSLAPVDYGVFESVAQYGYLGVPFFFMISGYVIAFTMDGRPAKQFLVARVIRLYPTFWLCCSITSVVLLFNGAGDLYTFLLNLTMLPEKFGVQMIDGVYWSLAVEIYFYLMMALLLLVGGGRLSYWIDGLIALGLLAATIKLAGGSFGFPIRGHFPLFAVGMLVFRFHRGDGARYLYFSFVAFLIATWAGVEFASRQTEKYEESFSVLVLSSIYAVMYVLMLVVNKITINSRSLRFVAICGGATYPVYLLHAKIGYAIFGMFGVGWLMLVMTTVAMTVMSVVVYLWFDEPVRKYLLSRAFGAKVNH